MNITKNLKKFLIISSLMMAIGISIGAFGAHGLKPYLDEYSTKIFQTGVSYYFYNTFGLFILSFIMNFLPNSKKLILSAYLLIAGTIIFSFSLYALALLKITWLGMITPIGGILIITAWLLTAYCLRDLENDNN